jgi:hypothetical protein
MNSYRTLVSLSEIADDLERLSKIIVTELLLPTTTLEALIIGYFILDYVFTGILLFEWPHTCRDIKELELAPYIFLCFHFRNECAVETTGEMLIATNIITIDHFRC